MLCLLKNEAEVFGQVAAGTAMLDSKLTPQGDEVAIELLARSDARNVADIFSTRAQP